MYKRQGWQRVAGTDMPAVRDQKAVLPAKVHSDDGADVEVADTSRIIAGGDDVIAVIEALGLDKQVFAAPTNTTTRAGLAAPHQFLFNRTTGVEGVLSLKGSENSDILSTIAKQLALYVVIYSPVQMVADTPENYAKFPKEMKFIRDVPTDWQETRVLNGEIGDYVTIARKERGGEGWYCLLYTSPSPRD